MKTLFQILIFIAVAGGFLFLYSAGTPTENSDPISRDAYFKQNIETEDIEFLKLASQSQNSVIPKHYKKYQYRIQYNLKVDGRVDKATFKLPIQNNEAGKQYITNFKIFPKPNRIYDADGNTIAEYKFNNLKTGNNIITIEGCANLNRYDIEYAKRTNKNFEKEDDIKRYLLPEKGIEINNPYIKNIANKITGNSKEEIVNNIFEYVRKNVHYNHGASTPSAVLALKAGRGKCGEFAAAMVALCRTKQIPARIVSGNIARKSDTKHTWVEVYFDEYGWVTYDPTVMYGERVHIKNGVIVKREQTIIENQNYIASIRNDFSSYYLTFSNHNTGYNGDIKLIENIQIKEIN